MPRSRHLRPVPGPSLVIHDADETILRRMVEKAVEAGILLGKVTGLIHSSPVHGAGTVAATGFVFAA